MEISEALKLKRKLEADITALLHQYRFATGIMPSAVILDAVDITRIGHEKEFVLAGVRVTVEL